MTTQPTEHPLQTSKPFSTSQPTTITIGTRRSQLARLQTDIVVSALRSAHPEHTYAVHALDPLGDRDKTTALHAFNAKALWTSELEALLSAGELDLVVHSLKDVPTTLPAGLALGAVPAREDPRDALVLARGTAPPRAGAGAAASAHEILAALPPGSVVGTSSLRRAAQLRARYPHLGFRDARGNVPTRLRKLDLAERPDGFRDTDDERREGAAEAQAEGPRYAALILAAAGLVRLGLGDRISAYLTSEDGGMLHAVGQGALGVEIREGDERIVALLEGISDRKAELACWAERSVMRTLEGGCSVPIGVETEWVSEEELRMKSVVVSLDGSETVKADEKMTVRNKEDADEFGRHVAKILVDRGAGKILEAITLNRKILAEQAR